MSLPLHSFASFPDLDPSPSTSSSKLKEKDTSSRREKEKKKKRDKGRERDGHGSKRRHRSQSREPRKDDRDRAYQQTELSELSSENLPLFYSDNRGDRLNIEYGGLHAGDIPRYHLFARGKEILGLPGAWIASHRTRHGVEVGIKTRRKLSELTDPKTRALLEVPPTHRILQSKDNQSVGDTEDFMRLSSRSKKSRNDIQQRNIEMIQDDDQDLGEASGLSDKDPSEASSEDESDTIQLTSYQLKLKDLNQGVEQEPTVPLHWLHLLRHMLSTISITSKNATVARAEITLSVMKRALQAQPQNQVSKILRLTYMKAGEAIWEKAKIKAEWEEALKVGGAEIWMEWLEWRIRKSEEGIVGVVHDAVRLLGVLGKSEHNELLKVRVLWRIGLALKHAGFTERSTALFQAQAELTFDLPLSLYNASHDTRIDSLEEFWESELPRIGEGCSEGWSAWVDGGKRQLSQPPQINTQISQDIKDLDPYRLWWKQETHGDHTHLIPSRSYSEQDDPYGTILFSDIKSLLVSLESEAARNAFRYAWLSCLGLHIPGLSTFMSPSDETNWDDRWNTSPLVSSSHLDALFPSDSSTIQLSADAVAGVIVGREKLCTSGFGPVRQWSYGILTPLEDPSLDFINRKAKSRTGLWTATDIQAVDQEFVRRIFSQLQLGEADEEWDDYSLAFEFALNHKGAIKHSRSLLKRAESLARWIAHAQLETLRGHPDDARKIFETVSKTIPNATSGKDIGRFWWTWTEMEWLSKNVGRSLEIILQSVQLQGDGRIMMLRARRSLDERLQTATDWQDREYWIRMRILLELLSGQDPSIAISVMDSYLGQISEGKIPHESLTVAALSILFHYSGSLKNPMPPVILRNRAEKALALYPSNSIILGIFLEGERGQSVWGRIKKLFIESEGEAKDLARRMEEVWMAGWERGRWSNELERTRSGLAGAVETERTRGSYVLWRVYLEFEIRSGYLSRAKKIFYRAIGECPLVKELYLIAFGPLRGVFNGRELKGIAETMVERGIRLWHDLDDVLSGWDIIEKEIERGSDSEEDEIMADAKEYRRLLPY